MRRRFGTALPSSCPRWPTANFGISSNNREDRRNSGYPPEICTRLLSCGAANIHRSRRARVFRGTETTIQKRTGKENAINSNAINYNLATRTNYGTGWYDRVTMHTFIRTIREQCTLYGTILRAVIARVSRENPR